MRYNVTLIRMNKIKKKSYNNKRWHQDGRRVRYGVQLLPQTHQKKKRKKRKKKEKSTCRMIHTELLLNAGRRS